jgi:cytochrome b6
LSKNPDQPPPGAAAWLRERIDLEPLVALAAKKTVPIHRRSWIYLLGGVALFLFGLQVATGALLMLYYQPTEAAAFQSVETIMSDVPYGGLIRSMHAWGAHLFIAVVCLHLLTTLFSRAYRKPRELTWLSGMMMLFVALGFGFSGYLLPWTELSYNATSAGTEIPGTIPGVGSLIAHFLRGGEHVTGETITRFFAAHVLFLPLALGGALLVHLGLIQAQGMSLPLGMTERDVRDHEPFFSEFLLTDGSVWLVLFGLIVTLAVFMPAPLGEQAELKPTPEGIKPEWYFLFMYQTLLLVPKSLGVPLLGLGVLFLLVLPFLDRGASRGRKSVFFTVLFVVLVAYAAAFEVWAILTPGLEHEAAEAAAEAPGTARSAVTLALFWAVIVFLVVYLQKLRRENARVRRLRAEGP